MILGAVKNGLEDVYEDARRDYMRRKAASTATTQATLSGAGTGALVGGVSKMLAGGRKPTDIALRALLGALAGGTMAGGSNKVGQEVLGPAEDDEPTPFTTRGAVGGLVGGGAIGAGLGALLGGGKLNGIGKALGGALKIAPDNLLMDQVKRLAAGGNVGKGAAMGGGLLGGVAAFQGADEGMQVDFLRNQALARRRARLQQFADEGIL